MISSQTLFILCVSFVAILTLILLSLTAWILQTAANEKKELRKQVQDLLNRLQSADLRTYHSLSSNPVTVDYPQMVLKSDAAEVKQLQDMGKSQGLGDTLYDNDEFRDVLSEFGLTTDSE